MGHAPQPETAQRTLRRATRSGISARGLQWLALFLVVAGVRLWLVASFGSVMPLLDQWDDEAGRIFKPYLEGTLGFRQLFAAHNEHRPVLGRLLALALLIVNDQWDARVQMAANALLAALAAVAVAWVAVKLIGQRNGTFVLPAVACWFCLPFAWENTTWAFQSSLYFLALFSILALWGLVAHPPFTRGWTAGAIATVLACLTIGSGFLAAAAVLVIAALRLITRRTPLREWLPTTGFCSVVVALGLALRVHVPDHDALRPASVMEWMNVFARGLAWPFTQRAAASLFVWLPVATLTVFYFRRKAALLARDTVGRAEVILAIAGWVARELIRCDGRKHMCVPMFGRGRSPN